MKQLNLFLMTFFCSILAIGAFSSCIDEEGPELKDSITLTVDLKDILDKLDKLTTDAEKNDQVIKELQEAFAAMKKKQDGSEEKIMNAVKELLKKTEGNFTAKLAVLEASIGAVKDKVGVLEEALAGVKTLEEKVKMHETAIAKITEIGSKVGELESTKKILEDKNTSMEERLKRLEGLFANLTMEGVDLGTGVLWAPMNLGARKETEFGGYYAWGELTPKDHVKGEASDFSLENYKFYENSQWNKYNNTDQLLQLNLIDDAANQTLGKGWRMPTRDELTKLIQDCTWVYKNGYKGTTEHGYIVTGKNNKSIFIPCGGFYEDGRKTTASYDYVRAYLWTSTLFPSNLGKPSDYSKAIPFFHGEDRTLANALDFQLPRASGLNIRPVRDLPKQ